MIAPVSGGDASSIRAGAAPADRADGRCRPARARHPAARPGRPRRSSRRRSLESRAAPRWNGGLQRTRSTEPSGTVSSPSACSTCIRSLRPLASAVARADRTADQDSSTAITRASGSARAAARPAAPVPQPRSTTVRRIDRPRRGSRAGDGCRGRRAGPAKAPPTRGHGQLEIVEVSRRRRTGGEPGLRLARAQHPALLLTEAGADDVVEVPARTRSSRGSGASPVHRPAAERRRRPGSRSRAARSSRAARLFGSRSSDQVGAAEGVRTEGRAGSIGRPRSCQDRCHRAVGDQRVVARALAGELSGRQPADSAPVVVDDDRGPPPSRPEASSS